MNFSNILIVENFKDYSQLVKIYKQVFSSFPFYVSETEIQIFKKSIIKNSNNPLSKIIVAKEKDCDEIVAFAYGYSCFEKDHLWGVFNYYLGEDQDNKWLYNDFFFLAEICVLPTKQRQGIGQALLERITSKLPNKKALLFTLQDSSQSIRFYRKNKWLMIKQNIIFSSSKQPFVIMGKTIY